jgi:hypothetical protein
MMGILFIIQKMQNKQTNNLLLKIQCSTQCSSLADLVLISDHEYKCADHSGGAV